MMSSPSSRGRSAAKATSCAPSEHARRKAAPPPTNAVLARAAEMLMAASYPTRLRILTLLLDEEATVQDLAGRLRIRDVVASQQLAVLRKAALVRGEKRGRHVFYQLSDDHAVALAEAAVAIASSRPRHR
ncbi:MAG: helix-turn-helix transcriptional regulator [Deltaproteobacteria bacterium]|nr:helix-turn-helix transcriptional regulator [Deltaproteobacteria bacterium]